MPWTKQVIIGIDYGTWLRVTRRPDALEDVGSAAHDSNGVGRVGEWKVVVGAVDNGERDVRHLMRQLSEIAEVGDGIFGSGDEFDRHMNARQPSSAFG